MTRDDIIRMAREADVYQTTDPYNDDEELWLCNIEELERFADLVAAAEREACAKICSDVNEEYDGEEVSAAWIAAAIRARGQE